MVSSITSATTSGIALVDTTRQQGTQRTDALGRPIPASNTDSGAISTTISRLAAGGPPVDTDRIATLRASIKAGTYRIDPQAIADRMVDGDMADNVGASL